MSFYVYIIYSELYDKYYIGQTNNVTDRIKRHNNGSEKFTSSYLPWSLKCIIEKSSRNEAMILENKLKNLNRVKLIKFIQKYS
jgi:putative endonuclease